MKTEAQLRREYASLCDKADNLVGHKLWEYHDLIGVDRELAVSLIRLDDEIVKVAKQNREKS
jgi:hypothetical protein